MEDKELQTRRAFFKQALRKSLPIIGVIALSNIPVAANAEPLGCRDGSCTNSCSGNCSGSCSGGCNDSCSGCKGSCTGSCSNQCVNICKY